MLASAQVAAENEEAYARLYAAQALHDNKDSVAAADGAAAKYQIDPDLLPACMPSPDVLLQIMDSIFGAAGGGRPVADFTHLLLRVTLTMQALMGFVLLGGVVGAYFGHPELALPQDMQHLVATAGDEFGITQFAAALVIPAAAGLGKVAAIAAFWFGGPLAEVCATLGLLVMYVLVAHVHHAAGVSVLPPAVFVALAMLKLCTATRRKLSSKVD